uniref:Uncharacterized protein n=1 Tax=Suricata suricatta TaxID=37032 RepID=A0A673U9X9_SURSU
MSDSTWLTSEICNPLAVGQYVNNCSNDRAANVCYQEFDVPAVFPIELKQYLPNIAYSCDKQRCSEAFEKSEKQQAQRQSLMKITVKKERVYKSREIILLPQGSLPSPKSLKYSGALTWYLAARLAG